MHGITFRVSCANRGSLNELRIEPEGLLTDNSPMVQDVDGRVTGAEVADLNADGSPELYVYVQSAGSGSGRVAGGILGEQPEVAERYLPATDCREPGGVEGLHGARRVRCDRNRLVQRFPLYRDADANATPTGGTREVRYRLDAGEAGWLLKVDRVDEK